MPRKSRLRIANGIYHVTTRGNVKRRIFMNDDDRRAFLGFLGQAQEKYHLQVLAYTLMGNHYHLIVRTPQENLPESMRYLNGQFAIDYNIRKGRTGHLFGDRYSARLIEQGPYLLVAARYVFLNPVRAGLVRHPREWPWSSYSSTTGKGQPPFWLDPSPILSECGAKKVQTGAFVEFVEAGLAAKDRIPEAMWKQAIWGSPTFLRRILRDISSKQEKQVAFLKDRQGRKPSLRTIFKKLESLKPAERNKRICRAIGSHKHSAAQVAAHLGLSRIRIYQILREYDKN